MSRADSDLAMRRLVAALRSKAKTDATTAATGAINTMERAVDDGVAEHAAKNQYVHGVGELYVAKTSHPSQFPNWADILNKPDWLRGVEEPGAGDDDQHIDGTI